jgi:hypothetical protein
MYYLQSRYYDPAIGRFINADIYASTGQGFIGCNMFAYCGNNPVVRMDASGYIFLDAARDLLNQWLNGDGSKQIYKSKSSIVRALKKSAKMNGYIERAINNYKSTGKSHTGLLTGEFTRKADGWDLYLSTQHFSYEIFVKRETRTRGFWFWKYKQERYVATVYVYDEYDFDPKPWKGVGNVMNNIAWILNCGGVGNDYKWTATYTSETKWKRI